jgi:hypothetical protein
MRYDKIAVALILGAALTGPAARGISQPAGDNGAKKDVQKAGDKTVDAAKTVGSDVKKGTEKAYDKTKSATQKAAHSTGHGAKKVWNKTKGAVEGGKEGAGASDNSSKLR